MRVASDSDVLQSLRERAAVRFQELGWPTTRLEEWKYTSLAPVAKVEWRPAAETPPAPDTSATMAGRAAAELVFVNGVFAGSSGDAGVVVRNLAADFSGAIEEHLGRVADEQQAMVALNTAHFRDGALVEIPPNTVAGGFIHLLFTGSGEGIWSHPRTLIVAGRNSQVTVVETYVGSGLYFTNAVTEIVAGDGAVVEHYRLGCESREAFHVGNVFIHQQRSSSVISRSVVAGGALVRNEVAGVLAGEGASLVLEGLFIGTGTQHLDNHTVIDHLSPHCDSQELYKGILDQNARGIFEGKIIVRPGAQKTVSRQENRNLLLSETATVDSKPTLEIHNDDVKCNHGSTIGQLEEEPLFYLRSRGLGEEEARNLLVYAFAADIVDRMRVEPVREYVRRALFRQMPERMPDRWGGGR
ncbi:MAG TPA: Fe-S cluster assembly protein SufD [Thermoanaerobaculia bacterium]|nr:Fe-S cluster assembly protein SufD [Thermoanaerobaculia bacterium]